MDTWSAAIMLFLIMDPLGNLPVFMSVLKSIEPKRRQVILIRELLFALGILFLFLFSGQSVLNFLNVEQETVSIAGGIILFLIALKYFSIVLKLSGEAVGETFQCPSYSYDSGFFNAGCAYFSTTAPDNGRLVDCACGFMVDKQ